MTQNGISNCLFKAPRKVEMASYLKKEAVKCNCGTQHNFLLPREDTTRQSMLFWLPFYLAFFAMCYDPLIQFPQTNPLINSSLLLPFYSRDDAQWEIKSSISPKDHLESSTYYFYPFWWPQSFTSSIMIFRKWTKTLSSFLRTIVHFCRPIYAPCGTRRIMGAIEEKSFWI